MAVADLILLEEDHSRFSTILEKLKVESNAKVVFLFDKNGQQLCSAGEVEGVDPTSLASLTAGNVAATDGLAKLLGEREFSILFHEGEHDNLHINVVSNSAILLVLFDERSSLGLVRLRVKKATGELSIVLKDVVGRTMGARKSAASGGPELAEITDADIDALFN